MGTRSSAVALFVVALAVFALQSAIVPAFPGRDMGRYIQTYVQLGYDETVLPSVMNTRGPLAALGVSVPLELGGVAAELWLALLYAASIVAWGMVAMAFGARAALLTTGVLLVYPGYGLLLHGLASDSLFAALFAAWALVLTRAMLRPSVGAFLASGLVMGLLVLVRPSNQVLIVAALFPLLVRGRWGDRLRWVASLFVASVAVTQGWKALAAYRWDDGVALRPATGVVVVAAILAIALAVPAAWRRRAALAAVVVLAGAAVVARPSIESPVHYARALAQIPGGNPFLFRVFEIDPIVSPDNGPASRELGQVVQRELLAKEPYRSYGVDLDEFFSSGSNRMFEDLGNLSGVDLGAVADEAMREHPGRFVSGIGQTIWHLLVTRRAYAPEAGGVWETGSGARERQADEGRGEVVVEGRTLPRPNEEQAIPASHFGPVIHTLYGEAREVWQSPTEHFLVFDDARDERRWEEFGRDTDRLIARLPTRGASVQVLHRANQASRAFPPPGFWLAVGLFALAIRRPRGSLVALAPAVAGLVLVVSVGLVAHAVGEYVAPVSPAFVMLAAVGLVGAHPRGRLGLRRPAFRRVSASEGSAEPE